MGLLSRASSVDLDNAQAESIEPSEESQDGFALDEMGLALRAKIAQLPSGSSFTVLSLLKAYGAFTAGVCLVLDGNTYAGVASLGVNPGRLSAALEEIWSAAAAKLPYYRLDPHNRIAKKIAQDSINYWVFPLREDDAPPEQLWGGALILGAAGDSIDPKSVSAILTGNAGKMLSKPERKPAGEAGPAEASSPWEEIPGAQDYEDAGFTEYSTPEDFVKEKSLARNALKEKIERFHSFNNNFNCIVLDPPASIIEKEKANFMQKVTDIINVTGTVIPLSSGSPLILLPREIDRELIAHRLSLSFKTKPAFSFEANNPDSVCEKISYLL